ncbi:MAG: hypothetical protein IJX80_02370 [Clostridia bacterium]|nr:hypothetical protein [Clostridia bacterium]
MFQPSQKTLAILEDIEHRIDPAVEEDFQNQWRDFLYGRFEGEIFQAIRKKTTPPAEEVPNININDAIGDYDLMLQKELAGVSNALNSETQSLCVRANYGTGILSSVFGAEIFVMPYDMNTLPTTRSVNDTEWIRAMVGRGMPDLENGFGKQVFEMGRIFAEVFAGYPKIQKYVTVYHPDLQGPLDIAELLWGGEMFYAMYDEPELVHAALSLITDTYTAFMKRWETICPLREDINPHWGTVWYRGKVLIRNDSAMNLSPDMYEEFAASYDGLLLERFGGGAVHFCGRGDHYIEKLCNLPGLTGVNLSQPQYNDMETIYRNTVDKGINILAFKRDRAKEDLGREGGFRHRLSI